MKKSKGLLSTLLIFLLSCGISKHQMSRISSETGKEKECMLVKADSSVYINPTSFTSLAEELNSFYESENEVDIMLFEMVSGKPNQNTVVRFISNGNKAKLVVSTESGVREADLRASDVAELISYVQLVNESHYAHTCVDYSSRSVASVFFIKSNGKELFSISCNSRKFYSFFKQEEKSSMQNEIALFDLLVRLRREQAL